MKKNRLYTIFSIFIFCSIFIFGIDLGKMQIDLDKINKRAYPDSNDVYVKNNIHIVYDNKGEGVITEETVIKIIDEVGKQRRNSINFYYNINYEEFIIESVKIVKKSGDIIDINILENSKELSNTSSVSANIYDDDSKVITLKIPDLDIEDSIYYKTKTTRIKPRIYGQFSDFHISEYISPFINVNILVEGPKEKPLKHIKVISGEGKNYKNWSEEKGDKILYYFESENIDQIVIEPDMPSIYEVVMRYLFTTLDSWRDVSKWYYELSEPKIIINEKIKNKVYELTENKTTDMEKIESIFFFVSRKVRYMGTNKETNRPGLEPHSSEYTFDTMSGVCRDKAALIVAMLRVLGYDANMVLINTSRKLDYEVPMSYFNHAIAGVTLENGKVILLDPTDETSNDIFPQYLMDKSYLLAKKDGADLDITPIIKAKDNMLIINTNIDLEDDKLICNSKLIFTGINDNTYRYAFVTKTKYDIEKLMNRILKNISNNVKLIDFEISPENLLDEKNQLIVNLNYEIDDIVINNGKYTIFKLPNLGDIFGMHNWLPGNMSLDERKFPIKASFTAGLEENINLNFTKKYNILLLPEEFKLETENYSYSFNYSSTESNINYKRENTMDKLEYSNIEYKSIKELYKKIERYRKKIIILENNK